MARPKKPGLDYFPKDVDSWDNMKIMMLVEKYGPLGYCVYDIVRDEIYKNGYFIETSLERLAFVVVRKIGSGWFENRELAVDVIRYCGEVGLFDEALLKQSVVTGKGIQRRYREVKARNKIDKSMYWLIEDDTNADQTEDNAPQEGVSAAIIPQNDAREGVSAAGSTQSKVKKSKVKKSKENERKERVKESTGAASPLEAPSHDAIETSSDKAIRREESGAPTLEEVGRYVRGRGYNFKPERFVNYYSAKGWRMHGDRITDWRRLCDNWEMTQHSVSADPPERGSTFDIDDLSDLAMF